MPILKAKRMARPAPGLVDQQLQGMLGAQGPQGTFGATGLGKPGAEAYAGGTLAGAIGAGTPQPGQYDGSGINPQPPPGEPPLAMPRLKRPMAGPPVDMGEAAVPADDYAPTPEYADLIRRAQQMGSPNGPTGLGGQTFINGRWQGPQ